MKKTILVSFSTAVLMVLLSVKPVFASVRCETQYGGNQVCVTTGALQINKKVFNPRKSDFVDNIFLPSQDTENGYKFKTGVEVITFKITVKNIGDNTLHNVTVTDTLPQYLFLTGETPSIFKFTYLNPGESQEMTVKARVVAESQLVAESCVPNVADANSDEGEHDRDTAQVCVGKGVLGVTNLPKTGPESSILVLSLSAISALAGFAFVKKSK